MSVLHGSSSLYVSASADENARAWASLRYSAPPFSSSRRRRLDGPSFDTTADENARAWASLHSAECLLLLLLLLLLDPPLANGRLVGGASFDRELSCGFRSLLHRIRALCLRRRSRLPGRLCGEQGRRRCWCHRRHSSSPTCLRMRHRGRRCFRRCWIQCGSRSSWRFCGECCPRNRWSTFLKPLASPLSRTLSYPVSVRFFLLLRP